MIPKDRLPVNAGADKDWVDFVFQLQHDEPRTTEDLVEQLLFDGILFGGDLGPNGNTYQGVDEGEVMTRNFIGKWVERFDGMAAKALETCEIYRVGNTQDIRECSECKAHMHFGHPLDRSVLNYCPSCGRKVEA